MNIVIYEDEGYKNFLPLTWTRPVYELRCGINTLAEKIIRQYPKAKVDYSSRYYLPGRKIMKLEKGLFINGRILAHSKLSKEIPLKGPDEVFVSGDEIVAVRAVSRNFEEVRKNARVVAKAKVKKVKVKVLKYPWELIIANGNQILQDGKHVQFGKRAEIHSSVVIYSPRHVFIDEGAKVEAGAVIDARPGPIYIGKGSIIRPLTYLRGPLSIGPQCRIGGETVESIFHGYSNKQHYGFIGHSYIGEWVNLGAGTTNSNLKNNYGTVKVMVNGKPIDTGEQFVGCFIADHAKLGIGTLIPTGAVIGVGANVFGGGLAPKYVPNFAWGKEQKYAWDKFISSAAKAMARRGKKLSEEEEKRLRHIYQS